MHRSLISLLLVLLVATASCGGSSTPTAQPDVTRDAASAWQELESNPGTPGRDYDPSQLLAVYRQNGQVPAGWPAGSLPQGANAAAQSNPMLRAETQYEALTDALASRYGLRISQQVYIGNNHFASFNVPPEHDSGQILQRIRAEASAFVDHALYSPLKRASHIPSDPDFAEGPGGKQWGHWKVNCPEAWDITQGISSVIIAVVDTGVHLTHEELAATVINPLLEFPAATCDIVNNDKTIEDTDGHGTFIAGLAVAQGNNARTITGAAPNCKVLPIKVSNESGWAFVADLIAGAYLADQLGARVINYSWGGPDNVPAEEIMINQVTANGTLFVCAAGNDGTNVDEYPSAFANALSTGSTNPADSASSFSNWGLAVDIAAPGQNLRSCGIIGNSAYGPGQGTSYAAPLVAAAAALLWSYRPELTLAQVRSALLTSGPLVPGFSGAVSRLDIGAALQQVVIPLIPSISGVGLQPAQIVGIAVNKGTLNLNLQSPQNIARATYTLDLAPVGTSGPEDVVIESSSGGASSVQFYLTALHNQPASLTVDYFSPTGHSGTVTVSPLWIFNQRGDIDGDGMVGPTDLAALSLLYGLRSSDAGYLGYADNDADGRITERDAAVVGYHYGAGTVPLAISAVTPTGGIGGEDVALTADVAGTGLLDYAWDFGGGATPNTSALPAPTITLGAIGDYAASLTVSSVFGRVTYPFTLSVTARPAPIPSFTATPQQGVAPLDVSFNASASYAPGGNIVEYKWSWDGDTNFEASWGMPFSFHQFVDAGDYTVRLRVVDDLGQTADTTLDITATP